MTVITTIRSATGFLRLRDDGLADVLDLTKTPTGSTQALTADQQTLVSAIQAATSATAQDAATANLLAGAAALLVRLQQLRDDITAANATYTTARNTYQSALSGLAAGATVGTVVTFLKTTQGTYLTADNTALTTVGTKLDGTIAELANTVKGLANDIARRSGSTATF